MDRSIQLNQIHQPRVTHTQDNSMTINIIHLNL
jgi:hypothetical protein